MAFNPAPVPLTLWGPHLVQLGKHHGCVFLLTFEVFLLANRLFFAYGGGAVGKKEQIQFPDGGNSK